MQMIEFQAIMRSNKADRKSNEWYKALIDERSRRLKEYPHVLPKQEEENTAFGFPIPALRPKRELVIKRDFTSLLGKTAALAKEHKFSLIDTTSAISPILATIGCKVSTSKAPKRNPTRKS